VVEGFACGEHWILEGRIICDRACKDPSIKQRNLQGRKHLLAGTKRKGRTSQKGAPKIRNSKAI
jgi:hypothetical protein